MTAPAAVDWDEVLRSLDASGTAVTSPLIRPEDCAALTDLYEVEDGFRSRVVMERHGYGRGEYRYFAYPLPPLVAALRAEIYVRLQPLANAWQEALGAPARFPEGHAAFLESCRAAGQSRPTPLLLRYGPGDYNRLHQDLYGEHVFPLQAVILLSRPETDFTGGELIVTEQQARRQSRAEVLPLVQGAAAIFAVNARPALGLRGPVRAAMRHGVSVVRSGRRTTLGIILHDAN